MAPTYVQGCTKRGGQGGQLPPQILADQKAPPGSGGAPHYYLPPWIFDRKHSSWSLNYFSRIDIYILCKNNFISTISGSN